MILLKKEVYLIAIGFIILQLILIQFQQARGIIMNKETTEESLNYETYKKLYKSFRDTNRKLLFQILRNSPREEVIKVCKKLKILKEDINPATDKLELMPK